MKWSDAQKSARGNADGENTPRRPRDMERKMAVSPEIQAEDSRWRELRQHVNHALRSEPVPTGLTARIEMRLAAERRRAQTLRALPFVSVLGAAAAIALTFVFWRPAPPAGELAPSRFAKAHEMCGRGAHNALNISNDVLSARRELDELRPYAVAVPDLRTNGYFVHGACECVGHGEFNVTQVGYETRDAQPHYLSLFSLDRRYTLEAAANPAQVRTTRTYQFAQVGSVGVLEWSELGGTFVITGELPASELSQLAGTFVVSTVNDSLRSLASVSVP